MKYLLLVPVAMFSIALQAQTVGSARAVDSTSNMSQTAAQAGKTATTAVSVPAELTKKLDAKKAKVGDEIVAKTTVASNLPDGTALPKGTKLVGKVTSVPGKSSIDSASRIAFDLDRAVLPNGQTVLVHTALTSIGGTPSASTADAAAMASNGTSAGDSSSQSSSMDSGTRMTLDVSSRR